MDTLVAQLREQREFTVDLDEGLSVRMRRPPEAEFSSFPKATGAELAARYAVGWSGFTEALLLGAAVGAALPVDFTAERWAEVIGDRADWIGICVERLMAVISAHIEARGLVAKN